MNSATHAAPTGAFNIRQLWAAVCVLGVAVVALAASLVYIQTRPLDGHTAAATLVAPALAEPAADAAASPLPVTTVGPDESVVPASAPARAISVKPAAVQKPRPQAASGTKAATAIPATPAATIVPATVVTVTVPNAPKVTVEGSAMRPADGNHGSNLPAALPQANVYSTERN